MKYVLNRYVGDPVWHYSRWVDEQTNEKAKETPYKKLVSMKQPAMFRW